MTDQLDSSFVGVSLSYATMKEIDLIDAFAPFIEEHNPVGYETIKDDVKKAQELLSFDMPVFGQKDNDNVISDSNLDMIAWLVNESLFDLLNEIAPDDCYFGSHPGDGSDYGFWQVEEEFCFEC